MRLWLTVALVFLLLLIGLDSKLPGVRRQGVFEFIPPSPYFHYLPRGTERGRVLVVHGLDANKEMMNLLCLGLSDAGFDVYSMDLPGHGDSTVGFNAMLARQAVSAALDSLGPDTIVIGHSLGGALLLDLANEHSFETMVLLSPAPTPIDRIRVNRVLALEGQFDLPGVQVFVRQLESAVAGRFELHSVPWAGHSGYMIEPEPIRAIVAWLGGDPSTLRTGQRLLLLILEILSALAIPLLWLRGKPIAPERVHIPSRIISYIASCCFALLVSSVVVVMKGLHLFTTGYLISLLLVAGAALLPWSLRKISLRFSQLFVSLFAAACVLGVAGYIGSELVHLKLSGDQWWRFGAIAFALLPLSLADEVLLRPIRPWWKAASVAVLTRILIAAFAITGVLTTNRSDAFLVLLIHFIVLFWIGLWFAGEWFRRNAQDPLATAVFTALIQAWIFAAIFVRI